MSRDWTQVEQAMVTDRKSTGVIDWGRKNILQYMDHKKIDQIKVGDAVRMLNAVLNQDGRQLNGLAVDEDYKIENSMVRVMKKEGTLALRKIGNDVYLVKVAKKPTKKVP